MLELAPRFFAVSHYSVIRNWLPIISHGIEVHQLIMLQGWEIFRAFGRIPWQSSRRSLYFASSRSVQEKLYSLSWYYSKFIYWLDIPLVQTSTQSCRNNIIEGRKRLANSPYLHILVVHCTLYISCRVNRLVLIMFIAVSITNIGKK